MPNYTINYNLKKPLQTEAYNIDDHNDNMDAIDATLLEHANEIDGKVDKVEGKDLSSNDFTDAYIAKINSAQNDISDLQTTKADLVDGKIPQSQVPPFSLPAVITGGTGSAYTAVVDGLTVTVGTVIAIIPHTDSVSRTPTLSVNGSSPKTIARKTSSANKAGQSGYTTNWLVAGSPLLVQYDGTYWVAVGQDKPNASDLSGTVPISRGGTGKTSWLKDQMLIGDDNGNLAQTNIPSTNGSILRQDATGSPYWSSPQMVREDIGAAPQSHTIQRVTGSDGIHGMRSKQGTLQYETDSGWNRAKADTCYWAATISPADWQQGDVNVTDLTYWWEATIENASISDDDVVIVMPADSVSANAFASILSLPETYDGGFKLYAAKASATPVNICYVIAHKEVQ